MLIYKVTKYFKVVGLLHSPADFSSEDLSFMVVPLWLHLSKIHV